MSAVLKGKRLLPCLAVLVALGLALLVTVTASSAEEKSIEAIVVTADKVSTADYDAPVKDGWVRFSDGSKQWVSADCRAQLVSAGVREDVRRWRTIRRMPYADWVDCPQLVQAAVSKADAVSAEPITDESEDVVTHRLPGGDTITPGPVKSGEVRPETDGDPSASPETGVESPGRAAASVDAETDPPRSQATSSEPDTESTKADTSATGSKAASSKADTSSSQASSSQPSTVVSPASEPDGQNKDTKEEASHGNTSDNTHVVLPSEKTNLELLKSNPTTNTQYDNNPFRDVPMSEIQVSDLTVQSDIYNERWIDTTYSGYFRTMCEVSHFAYDDPIVFPNQPGRAHLHMFFGNTDTNAYSTFDSLLNTGTGTCNGEDLNRSAYWVPAMLDSNGNALVPNHIMIYYKNDNFTLGGANELVSPFPDNLRMIAGNGGATSPQTTPSGDPGSLPEISFSCGPWYHSRNAQPLIPDCSGTGNVLEMKVAFPACFNSAAGTYRSDQSHVSHPVGGYYGVRCPDSHSTDLSSIMYRIFFNPSDYGGQLTDLHLSSDVKNGKLLAGGTTSHADWFGAWHPETMDMWVNNCNNSHADCEIGVLQRGPDISMVKRKRGFYGYGYVAPAAQLVELCPGKTLDTSNPVVSVSHCRH